MISPIRIMTLLLFCLAIVGCSEDGTGKRYTVSGYVRFATSKTDWVAQHLGKLEVNSVDGVPVELISNGTVFNTAVTTAGYYEFRDVFPGNYAIRSRLLPRYAFSTDNFEVDGVNVVVSDTLELGPAGNLGAYPNPFWDSVRIGFQATTDDTVQVDLYSADYDHLLTLGRVAGRRHYGMFWDGNLEDDSNAPDGAYWVTLSGALHVQDWMMAVIGGETFAGPRGGGVYVPPRPVIHAENSAAGFEFEGRLDLDYPVVGNQKSFLATQVVLPSGRFTMEERGYGTYTLSQFDDTLIRGSIDALLFSQGGMDSIRVTGSFEADPYVENSLHMTADVDGFEVQSTSGYEGFRRHLLCVSALDWDFKFSGRHYFGCRIEMCVTRITPDFERIYTVGSRLEDAEVEIWLLDPIGYNVVYHGVSGTLRVEEVDSSEWLGIKTTFSFVAANDEGDTVTVSDGVTDPQGPNRSEYRMEHQLLVKDSTSP